MSIATVTSPWALEVLVEMQREVKMEKRTKIYTVNIHRRNVTN
jgi:hypothetical protein